MSIEKLHLMIVDDPSGGFSSKPGVHGAAGGAAPTIYKLRHPKGRNRLYILSGVHLLELQKVGQQPGVPSSWFIDQSVKSDGGVLVATPVDPLLLALPMLDKAPTATSSGPVHRFSPLHQYLRPEDGDSSVDMSLLLRVEGLASNLASMCDTALLEEQDGRETTLYRLNRDKARAYLVAKARRLAYTLQAQAEEAFAKARTAAGTFFVGTTADGECAGIASSSSSAPAVEGEGAADVRVSAAVIAATTLQRSHLETSLGLLAEYLTDNWTIEVADALGVSLDTILPAVARSRRMSRLSVGVGMTPVASPAVGAGTHTPSTIGMATPMTGVRPADTSGFSMGSACDRSTYDGPEPEDEEQEMISSSRAAAWNNAALAENAALAASARGADSVVRPIEAFMKRPSIAGDGASKMKTPVAAPASFAAKRLATTSTKGMKSMTSFFSTKKA